MPLVRISLKGRPNAFAKKIGDITARTIIDTLYVPGTYKMQIVTAYGDTLTYSSSEDDPPRENMVVIEIALRDGRTVELKNKLFNTIVEKLKHELDIPPQDVFINLVEIKLENWAWRNT